MFQQLALIFLISFIDAAYLPTYISKCSSKSKTLNECIKRLGNRAIPKIAKGDIHYDLPFMCPLYLPYQITLKNDTELKFTITNNHIYGIENTRITKVNFNANFTTSLSIPHITNLANYEINGKLLTTPIYGNGFINITLVNVTVDYEGSCIPKTIDGDQYYNITIRKLTYQTKKSIYYLDDLYNGDAYLGNYMNDYINKHWMAVQQVLKPAASSVMKYVIDTVQRGIADNVPINDIFLP